MGLHKRTCPETKHLPAPRSGSRYATQNQGATVWYRPFRLAFFGSERASRLPEGVTTRSGTGWPSHAACVML
jgi:hypothetical protein